jgi:biotin operon repressor
MENKKIQQEIIEILNDKNECELGYLVRELNYSYNQILQNVMQLKKEGKIFKLVGRKGYFTLKNN